MTIEITRPTDHLYHQYPAQSNPQPVFLELRPEDDPPRLRADWDGEIGNAVPMSVYHGRVIRFGLPSPYYSGGVLCRMLDEIASLCETICAGYSSEWDGNNHVGRLTDEAQDAREAVEQYLERQEPDLQVYDAADWYQTLGSGNNVRVHLGITGQTTDDELATISEHEHEVADLDGVLVSGIDRYLEQLRDEAREDAE